MGHRGAGRTLARGRGHPWPRLGVPAAERGGHGLVVALLLQGPAGGRRIARGPGGQVERGHHHRAVVPLPGGAAEPEGGAGGVADNGRQHIDVTEMKLLIIEDERELSDNIVAYLSSESYVCDQAFTYGEAKMKVNVYDYDCVLLDLMLPGGSGLDLLRDIRSRRNPVGVIIVSAKGSLEDKVKGLELGADDYLPKPFHLAELSMRIYAIIRRKEFSSANLLRSDGIEIDLPARLVSVNGKPVTLTRMEYELLLFFIGNKNRVLSKAAIAEHLNGDMADLLDSHDFIYTHVKNLKAKLAEAGAPNRVRNVYGAGYKWVEP